MKAITVAVVLGGGLLGWTAVPAQDRLSDEATVRALDDQARVAVLEQDFPTLERLWAESFTVNAPNGTVVVGRRAVFDRFVRAGVTNYSSFDREVEFVRVDGDIAVIMGSEAVRSKSDAPDSGLAAGEITRRRFTNIWRRQGGTWRQHWRHANPIRAVAEEDANRKIIRRLYDELFSKWSFAVVDEVFSPDFVSHDMPPGTPRGPEGVRQFYTGIRSGLPDAQLTVEDMIAEGDKVVVRWRARATHNGPFLGVPPTGQPLSFTGLAVYRVAKGKVVERWVEVGLLGVAEQLRSTAPASKTGGFR